MAPFLSATERDEAMVEDIDGFLRDMEAADHLKWTLLYLFQLVYLGFAHKSTFKRRWFSDPLYQGYPAPLSLTNRFLTDDPGAIGLGRVIWKPQLAAMSQNY